MTSDSDAMGELYAAFERVVSQVHVVESGLSGYDGLFQHINLSNRPYDIRSCGPIWRAMSSNDFYCYILNPDQDNHRPFDPHVVLIADVAPECNSRIAGIVTSLIDQNFLSETSSLLLEGARGAVSYSSTKTLNDLLDDVERVMAQGISTAPREFLSAVTRRMEEFSLTPSDAVDMCADRRRGTVAHVFGEHRIGFLSPDHFLARTLDSLSSGGISTSYSDSEEHMLRPKPGGQPVDAARFMLSLYQRSAHGFAPAILEKAQKGTVVQVFGLYDLFCGYVMNALAKQNIHFIGAVPRKCSKVSPGDSDLPPPHHSGAHG